jgi:hypothetical protein
MCSGTAITIRASDVTLILNGHELRGDGVASGGLGAFFGHGIFVDGAPRAQIFGGSLSGNTPPGKITGFSQGIRVRLSPDTRIGTLVCSRNADAIEIGGSPRTLVANCTVNDNRVLGISAGPERGGIGNSDGSRIVTNTSSDNRSMRVIDDFGTVFGGSGIGVNANNCVVQSNETNNNFVRGIGVAGTGNRIRFNTALNNRFIFNGFIGGLDLFDENRECGSNLWENNTFGTSFPDCIR